MDPTMVAFLSAVIGFVLGALVVYFLNVRRRSLDLKTHFGHEYDRTLNETGNRMRAESVLEERRTRVQRLSLRHLSNEERLSFEQGWNNVQARFVDDPSGAIAEADRLLGEVMQAVGYPKSDFEQQAGDISVDHPETVQCYREAHSIAMRTREHNVPTEQLRVALLHYKTIFGELVGDTAFAALGRNKV